MITFIKKVLRRLVMIRLKRDIKRNEKIFTASNGMTVRYYFKPAKKKNDTLVTVFSGFSAIGKPAVYNLVSTLKGISAARLYILDDFGYQKRGVYYLGENGSFAVRDAVCELIEGFKMAKNVFCGSSKGGTAAIYFGLLCEADLIVSGAPQCFIGTYLTSQESHVPLLDAIAGDHSPDSVEKYDRLLPDLITSKRAVDKTVLMMHYSKQEHTYRDHIEKMLTCLQENGYCVQHDVATYLHHRDVANFFPQLCLATVQRYLKNPDNI